MIYGRSRHLGATFVADVNKRTNGKRGPQINCLGMDKSRRRLWISTATMSLLSSFLFERFQLRLFGATMEVVAN